MMAAWAAIAAYRRRSVFGRVRVVPPVSIDRCELTDGADSIVHQLAVSNRSNGQYWTNTVTGRYSVAAGFLDGRFGALKRRTSLN